MTRGMGRRCDHDSACIFVHVVRQSQALAVHHERFTLAKPRRYMKVGGAEGRKMLWKSLESDKPEE